MEFFLLPILALIGVALLLDTGGDDDDEETVGETPENDLNYLQFGPEDDLSEGTSDNDAMYLGVGDDFATGGLGNDKIFMGEGQDATVDLGKDGSFETEGMEGDDFIRGGEGRDILVDALGSNTIYGDTGYDRINAIDAEGDEGTPDTLYGGFGRDVLFGDNGDVMSGGAQEDRFTVLATDNMDPVTITDFAEGDTLLIREDAGGYQVIERITTVAAENGEDTQVLLDGEVILVLQGITELPQGAITNPSAPPMYGGVLRNAVGEIVDDEFNDDIVINDYTNAVFALGGNDTVGFASGADTADRDMQVNGGAGDDVLTLGEGDDLIQGGLGADTIFGGGGFDEISAGFGNDDINSLDQADFAGDGTALPSDIIDAGDGADTITFDTGDAVTGGAGVDSFIQVHAAGDPAVTAINDFDAARERIVIRTTSGTAALGFTNLNDGSGSYVTIGTEPVMYLIGVNATQAAAADITLVRI